MDIDFLDISNGFGHFKNTYVMPFSMRSSYFVTTEQIRSQGKSEEVIRFQVWKPQSIYGLFGVFNLNEDRNNGGLPPLGDGKVVFDQSWVILRSDSGEPIEMIKVSIGKFRQHLNGYRSSVKNTKAGQ